MITKEKFKKYLFDIYWKKNLLFILLFINFDFLPVYYPGTNCFGFPFKYYCTTSSSLLGPTYFSISMFVVGILFWYLVAGLLIEWIEGLKKINKKNIVLDYATLVIVIILLISWILTLRL